MLCSLFPEWSRILIKWGSTPNIYLPEYFTFKSPLTLLWTRIFLTLTDKMEYFQDMVSLEKSILTRRRVWGIKHTFYGKTNQVVQILQILPSNQKNELTILLLSIRVDEKMSRYFDIFSASWIFINQEVNEPSLHFAILIHVQFSNMVFSLIWEDWTW